MKKTQRFIFLIFICILTMQTMAQPVLILSKEGKTKRQRYHIGDEIVLKTKDKQLVKGQITNLNAIGIEIDNQFLDIDSIAVVYKQFRLLALGSEFIWKGGAMYFVLDITNSALVGIKPIVSRETVVFSACLITIGLTLRMLSIKKHNLNKGWQIRVVDF